MSVFLLWINFSGKSKRLINKSDLCFGEGGCAGGSHKCQPLFRSKRGGFIEQLKEEVSAISFCAIITYRSANQNVDNRRQSGASLDSLLMERLTN